jgi:prophage regulatory protein
MGNHPTSFEQTDPLLRLKQVLEIIPVSKSTWWAGVKSGRFPQPVKLGPRTTCWRKSEVQKLKESGTEGVR